MLKSWFGKAEPSSAGTLSTEASIPEQQLHSEQELQLPESFWTKHLQQHQAMINEAVMRDTFWHINPLTGLLAKGTLSSAEQHTVTAALQELYTQQNTFINMLSVKV